MNATLNLPAEAGLAGKPGSDRDRAHPTPATGLPVQENGWWKRGPDDQRRRYARSGNPDTLAAAILVGQLIESPR
jgi:hypothetical protein